MAEDEHELASDGADRLMAAHRLLAPPAPARNLGGPTGRQLSSVSRRRILHDRRATLDSLASHSIDELVCHGAAVALISKWNLRRDEQPRLPLASWLDRIENYELARRGPSEPPMSYEDNF